MPDSVLVSQQTLRANCITSLEQNLAPDAGTALGAGRVSSVQTFWPRSYNEEMVEYIAARLIPEELEPYQPAACFL